MLYMLCKQIPGKLNVLYIYFTISLQISLFFDIVQVSISLGGIRMNACVLCPLFQNLSSDDFSLALRFFDAQEAVYPRGSFLHLPNEPLRRFGLVLSGAVQVSMPDIHGNSMVLNCVTAGQTFGEALCYLQKDAPLVMEALRDTSLFWLRCDNLLHAQESGFSPALCNELQRRFTSMLAERALRMNDRIQILSRMSIREKLRAFFTECARDAGGLCFDVPFDRAGMAAYLGVDRSALSRALACMQADGEISYKRNHFSLKKA